MIPLLKYTLFYKYHSLKKLISYITNRGSFENLKSWFSGVKNRYTEAKFIIAGNKADLEDHRKVSTMEGQKFADENDALYFGEVSAKTNLNIDELFLKISDVFSSFFDENSFPRYLKANLLDD